MSFDRLVAKTLAAPLDKCKGLKFGRTQISQFKCDTENCCLQRRETKLPSFHGWFFKGLASLPP